MSLKNFLRFPSDKDAEKYQYQRTVNIVIAITAAVGLCLIFLALYATIRNSLLFIGAGSCAGVAVALWYVTKPPADEEP